MKFEEIKTLLINELTPVFGYEPKITKYGIGIDKRGYFYRMIKVDGLDINLITEINEENIDIIECDDKLELILDYIGWDVTKSTWLCYSFDKLINHLTWLHRAQVITLKKIRDTVSDKIYEMTGEYANVQYKMNTGNWAFNIDGREIQIDVNDYNPNRVNLFIYNSCFKILDEYGKVTNNSGKDKDDVVVLNVSEYKVPELTKLLTDIKSLLETATSNKVLLRLYGKHLEVVIITDNLPMVHGIDFTCPIYVLIGFVYSWSWQYSLTRYTGQLLSYIERMHHILNA